MLLTTSFPIFDARWLVDGDTGRMMPSSVHGAFLRGFGRLTRRDPLLVARADRALRLASWPTGRASGERGDDPFFCAERTITFDGDTTAVVLLALGCRDPAALAGRSAREVVEGFVEARVAVPGRSGLRTVRLARASHFLAAAWASATTRTSRRDVVEPWWITGGRPAFELVATRGELDTDGLGHITLGECRVATARLPFAGAACPLWIIEIDPAADVSTRTEDVRSRPTLGSRLPARLVAQHARREALRAALAAVAAGQLAPAPRSPASDRLQAFLNQALHVIGREERRLPDPLFASPGGGSDEATRGETLSELVEQQLGSVVQVRPNILRKTLAWLEREGHRAGPRAAPPDARRLPIAADIGPINAPTGREIDDAVRGDEPTVNGPTAREISEAVRGDEPTVANPTDDLESLLAPRRDGPRPTIPTTAPILAPPATSSVASAREPHVGAGEGVAHSGPITPELVLAEERVALYPRLRATPESVAPDELVRFALLLGDRAPVGVSAEVGVTIGAGSASTTLRATVSSTDFRPEGPWSRDFTVNRDGTTSPSSWAFAGRALGDRESYGLRVIFTAAGLPAGAVSLRLARRGAVAGAGGEGRWASSGNSGEPSVRVPLGGGPPATIQISLEGPSRYRFTLLENGQPAADPQLWDQVQSDVFFGYLEGATDYAQLKEVGYGLLCDLPPAVADFCFRVADGGAPLLITGAAPIAPFELLARTDDGPLLGLERPVVRWLDRVPLPEVCELPVFTALTVRPDYGPPDALPSAAEEERRLQALLQGRPLSLQHAATLAELDAAMQRTATGLLHFAGHAGGDPAFLQLQDQPIRPTYFGPSKPFLARRPFVFLNGCRAGRAKAAAPSQQANLMNVLLRCASGAVAPLVTVKSEAALVAATTFYDAVLGGAPVAEAVQRIHRLAAARAAPGFAASWMSYLAFGQPSLRLRFA